MELQWYIWSFIPGLHWLAWIQAGNLTKVSWYYWVGLVHASPLLLFFSSKTLSLRLILGSWLIALLQMQMQRYEINRRIAKVASAQHLNETMRQPLLQAALHHKGCLSVTEGVMETGRSFDEVEQALKEMEQSGYVFTRNNPDTGVIEYVFKEFL